MNKQLCNLLNLIINSVSTGSPNSRESDPAYGLQLNQLSPPVDWRSESEGRVIKLPNLPSPGRCKSE